MRLYFFTCSITCLDILEFSKLRTCIETKKIVRQVRNKVRTLYVVYRGPLGSKLVPSWLRACERTQEEDFHHWLQDTHCPPSEPGVNTAGYPRSAKHIHPTMYSVVAGLITYTAQCADVALCAKFVIEFAKSWPSPNQVGVAGTTRPREENVALWQLFAANMQTVWGWSWETQTYFCVVTSAVFSRASERPLRLIQSFYEFVEILKLTQTSSFAWSTCCTFETADRTTDCSHRGRQSAWAPLFLLPCSPQAGSTHSASSGLAT